MKVLKLTHISLRWNDICRFCRVQVFLEFFLILHNFLIFQAHDIFRTKYFLSEEGNVHEKYYRGSI
jgi:hypothetical protein